MKSKSDKERKRCLR